MIIGKRDTVVSMSGRDIGEAAEIDPGSAQSFGVIGDLGPAGSEVYFAIWIPLLE